MKKYVVIFICALVLNMLYLFACNTNDGTDNTQYPFTDVAWTRQAEHDEETIRFGADGSFTYSCACGNPVNDSDLCESYSYDDATKTITLNCIETTEEMITLITVEECSEDTLVLKFGDQTRTFSKRD